MSIQEDGALLRRFEPVIRYTRGERFFPMDVEPYVCACSLWMQKPREEPVCLIPEGKLTLERLAQPRARGSQAVYYLKFIDPLNIAELAADKLKALSQGLRGEGWQDAFRAGRGRLARVGYTSRLVDALFSLSLLARGSVPGATAAAAIIRYRRILSEREEYCYYGRVVRENHWIVLQYWFFYPFNDWRSGFFGVNDHESDWEMITLYLSESGDGEVRPQWAAYASHDFSGDDLRRRWDDPEMERVGEHPVVYAGAGSHASYYAPGEFLSELELSFLSPLARIVERAQTIWRRTLRQEEAEEAANNLISVFQVPFVDYARGDGLSIGPGQTREWDAPRLLDPTPEWASGYRGLWGLYARDPIAGENAPAGPLYNRDGTVRRAWYDPLGWAGLDKVPPLEEIPEKLLERRRKVVHRLTRLTEQISQKSNEIMGLGVESRAMEGFPHLKKVRAAHQEGIAALSEELDRLRSQVVSDQALLEAIDVGIRRIESGERAPARSHLHRAHRPASDDELRLSRFAETWAAISIGLMVIGLVGIILFYREHLIAGLVSMVTAILFIESGFRRQLSRLIASLTTALAVVSALVIFYEFFWEMIVLAVLLAGAYIIWENVSELWR
ncbi:MAG: hypothetical protein L6435_11635 [Anaerolineae bacterium]|nr:hypothetical protein [Anaerolineae bacterium]